MNAEQFHKIFVWSYCVFVTVQWVCAFTALTVRKHGLAGKNPIAEGNFQWIFARNCEGTEQLRVFKYLRMPMWSVQARRS